MPKIAIFPGSFDPFTRGHLHIVEKSILLFDQVIVAIGVNTQKQRYFPIEDTHQKISELFEHESTIEVCTYEGLTVSLAEQKKANYLIRGLRNTIDFEYEKSIALANKKVYPEIETVYFNASPEYGFLSSTILREMHKFGADIQPFIPYKL